MSSAPSSRRILKMELSSSDTEEEMEMIVTSQDNDPTKKMYRCDQCPYSSDRSEYLKQHKMVHDRQTKKKHRCPHPRCKYSTNYKSGLNRHSLIHKSPATEKRFQCQICDYETDITNNFKRHSKTHDHREKRLFACRECNYSSYISYNLWRHEIRVHKKSGDEDRDPLATSPPSSRPDPIASSTPLRKSARLLNGLKVKLNRCRPEMTQTLQGLTEYRQRAVARMRKATGRNLK